MAKPKPQKGASKVTEASAPLTQENFEKELQALAQKANEQTFFNRAKDSAGTVFKAITILAIAAGFSAASQLNLSPVYGAIPASIWHEQVVNAACFLGWSGSFWLRRKLRWRLVDLAPVIGFWIPTVQSLLFPFSGTLGATYGPVVTEVLALVPLLVLSAACAGLLWDEFDIQGVWQFVPGTASFVFFKVASSWSGNYMQHTASSTLLQTRLGYQVQLAVLYALLAPSKLLLYAIPALFHTAVFNTHVQSPWATHALNSRLADQGYKLLARQDSVTGYISVLESAKDHYRVLRCDHSLLGGEWLTHQNGDDIIVKEPIYAIFAMLEAVRLVEVPILVPDIEAQALVIGAGIGTSPGALIAHGINTTIVEIDPVVLEYATKYFGLSLKHNAVVADAVSYASQVANDTTQRYDYIIHDVFTGGAEPVDLFTAEFLSNLETALKPNGVIAINYASDLLQPTTHLIIRTILSVFPTCRIYRETPPPTPAEILAAGQDFTNMVVFCHTNSSAPLTFRRPIEADFLRSGARRAYLVPKHEIELDAFDLENMEDVLRIANRERLVETQRKSAVGHWEVMRTVVPGKIWELW